MLIISSWFLRIMYKNNQKKIFFFKTFIKKIFILYIHIYIFIIIITFDFKKKKRETKKIIKITRQRDKTHSKSLKIFFII